MQVDTRFLIGYWFTDLRGGSRCATPSNLVDGRRRIPILGAQSQEASLTNTDWMRTQLVDQTPPASPKAKEESPVRRSAPVMMAAVDGSPGAICIRYIAPKAEPKTDPESESKTDPATVHKTATIVDETIRSKIEEGDNDDLLSDGFGPSDDESGNAPNCPKSSTAGTYQTKRGYSCTVRKERAGEMEYPPLPVDPHTLLGDLCGDLTEQNDLSKRTNGPSHDGWNVEGCAETQPTRRVALSPHTQVVIPEGP